MMPDSVTGRIPLRPAVPAPRKKAVEARGFRLVVEGVAGGDGVTSSRGDLPGEEIVPCLSCFLLDVSFGGTVAART